LIGFWFQQSMEKAKEKANKPKEPTTASGWGSWAGLGAPPPPKHVHKDAPLAKPKPEKPVKERMPGVIINDTPIQKYAELQVATVPYPYRSRSEYEAAMAGAIGKEWNVTSTVTDLTKPEVQFTKGRIIKPLSKRAKAKTYRAPARF